MLHQRYPPQNLRLIARVDWHPFPTIDDRRAWVSLPDSIRTASLADGEVAATQDWPTLLAVRYLDYARDGNRSRFERSHFGRRNMLAALAMAECVENSGRFLDEIVNGIWLICEESSWCVPAHIGVQQTGAGLPDTVEPTVDLFAAETSALLSWVDYLLGDRLDAVSPLVRPRIQREIDARILTPCMERDDFGWMGFRSRKVNNWNPWINSNWLTSALLMEPDESRRLAAVAKSMRSLDRFIDPYPRDGGCDEGPSYWGRAGASLLDCLELLYAATSGQVNVYGEPLVQEIGRFIYRVHIGEGYFCNFADAPAVVAPPPAMVFRYGQRIGDPDLTSMGAWLAAREDILHRSVASRVSLGRLLPTWFAVDEIMAAEPRAPLPRDVWLPEIQVMAARDRGGSNAGLYVAAKGGHNAESHNHNDVGNVIVYVDGKPVIVDAGVETYTRKTFSAQRYEIWTMQSSYHSLPTVNGVMQAPGEQFAAQVIEYQADDAMARLVLELAAAYPPEAQIERWQRTTMLCRGRAVRIIDAYALAAPPNEMTLSLLTPCQVSLSTPGEMELRESLLGGGRVSGRARLTYDAARFAVEVQEIAIDDERLGQVWGASLKRLLFRAVDPAQQDTWTFRVATAE